MNIHTPLILVCAFSLLACQPPYKSNGQATAAAAEPPSAQAKTPQSTAWTLRPPGQVQEEGNHLKGQGSVYLLQHAQNPLEWYPWGEEALARARAEDKPIFLSIGYASCHWCHVMEHEVFEKENVASFMNENFVNIKVDREERPDLDTIYMDAVQSLTGRGGWPMTVLLTPSLKPFFGGTYFPEARFMKIVTDALKRYKEKRNEVEAESDRVYAQIAKTAEPGRSIRVGEQRHQSVVQRAVRSFDPDWGGLRGRMKFPTPIRWRYLLRSWRKWGGDELEAGIKRTLDQMAAGGIHDQLGGGFHRYTTEKTWLVPHFEKMLYDNAQLTELFLEASAAFGSPAYLQVARKTMDFMLKEMYEDGGGFYASYDADSGGEEGTFYVWKPEELVAIAGGRDGNILARLLGVTPGGNFEHRTSILTWRTSCEEVAASTGHPVATVLAAWKKWQPVMYDVRSKRVWPGLDKKIVSSWNGLAVGAMARGYAATGDQRYLKAAKDTADYLWRVHRRKDGGLYRVSNQGKPLERAVLDDYAFLASGLLDLFEVTGELATLERVRQLIGEADRRFGRDSGGWYMAESVDQNLVLRPFDTYDAVRPSGNSRLLDAHLRLAALAGDNKGFATVQKSLGAYAQLAGQAGLGMAGWLDVALRQGGPFYEVVIAGDPGHPQTAALQQVWKDLSPPWAVRVDVSSKGPSAAQVKALPPVDAKRGKDGGPLAYVCVRGSCKIPTADPATFRTQLKAGWTH